MAPDAARFVAQILNAAYMVRHYSRGGRVSDGSPLRRQRSDAITALGIAVREAFNACQDFEALLTAVYQGLAPTDDPPF